MEDKKFQKQAQIERIINESFLKPFLDDEGITDISWDGTELRLKHNQRGSFPANRQPDASEARALIRKIADIQEKQFNDSEAILDTEIGVFRVNAVHEIVSDEFGMTFSLRVSRPKLAISSLEEITDENAAVLLKLIMRSRSNLIISGATGSGKTELQKLLVGHIPDDDYICLIEDTRDSHIKALYPHKHIKSWRTLTDESRDKKVTFSDLIATGLRNDPDWLIISETRGDGAGDILDAAKTNHSIVTTLHSKGAAAIPSRFIPLVRQSPTYAYTNDVLIGKQIVDMIRFGIHMQLQNEDGKMIRFPKELVEFTGFDESGTQYSYLYRQYTVFDEARKEYVKKTEYNSLSEQSKRHLAEYELLHLLPDVFY
ncbi:ATPase, T2SS/T4P/T4SS family [Bacillus subtilis]|uniref:ATPase, T2SS/T4P/T4SS family n=1 Tax=Bacillus subtilis TaxID=1423 RepID=UPI0015E6FB8C|nr:ATPase, T2SS/T4P/T4SS family [Bacillus subtilis]